MQFNFKTATKEQLQNEYNRIAAAMDDSQFFTKKELHHLPEVLAESEQVLAFSSGFMNNNTWLITLTDRRILFLDKGLIYGLTQLSIDLDKVNTISGETGLIFGSMMITDGAQNYLIKNVWKKTVKTFTNMAQHAIDARKKLHHAPAQPAATKFDPYEQLGKLAELKEKGVITAAEFEVEKKKILGAA